MVTFNTPDQAVAIANGIDYGLSASVWSRDFDTCIRLFRRHVLPTRRPGCGPGGFHRSGLGRNAVAGITEEKTLRPRTVRRAV